MSRFFIPQSSPEVDMLRDFKYMVVNLPEVAYDQANEVIDSSVFYFLKKCQRCLFFKCFLVFNKHLFNSLYVINK